MKRLLILVCVAFFFATSCNNSAEGDAMETMKNIQKETGKIKAGMVATTTDGYMMKAKIDGKQWEADAMYPPELAARLVGERGKVTIGLPYSRSGYKEGKIINLGENYAADLFTDDDVAIWGGYTGQMQITKMGDKWIEGTFYFTGTAHDHPGKTMPVTEGFFRIPVKE